MSAGRPLKALPKNWKDIIIDLYSQGASTLEVAVSLGLSKATLYNRMKDDQQLLDAIKEGEALSEIWWEKMGRQHLATKEFNSTLWYMNMKNRFGWRDKKEVEVSDKRPIMFPEGLTIETKPETDSSE